MLWCCILIVVIPDVSVVDILSLLLRCNFFFPFCFFCLVNSSCDVRIFNTVAVFHIETWMFREESLLVIKLMSYLNKQIVNL